MEYYVSKKIIKKISQRIWNLLRQEKITRSTVRETTLTDIIFSELINHSNNSILAKQREKEESKNGADMEWWIWSRSSRKAISFRIQAKKLDYKTSSYLKLDHKYQMENLINTSMEENFVPMYFFYNYLDDEQNIYHSWEYAFAHDIASMKSGNLSRNFKKRIILEDYCKPVNDFFCESDDILEYILKSYIKVNPSIIKENYYKENLPLYIQELRNSRKKLLNRKLNKKKQVTNVGSNMLPKDSSFKAFLNEIFNFSFLGLIDWLKVEISPINHVKFPFNAPDIKYIIFTEI